MRDAQRPDVVRFASRFVEPGALRSRRRRTVDAGGWRIEEEEPLACRRCREARAGKRDA